jgi:hypothetical protein
MKCFVALVLGALALAPAPALAQVPGTLDVHVTTANASAPDGALVEALEADGSGALASATVPDGGGAVTLAVPFAHAIVRVSKPGFQGAEGRFVVVPGEAVSLAAHLAVAGAAAGSTLIERDRIGAPRRIAIDGRAAADLPGGTTIWSLLETVHPFLIADRIDGGGQWPGEPARLGSQQGSPGVQTAFRVDGVDVSDPRIVGAAAVGGDLASLAGIVVQTAAIDPAAAGPGPVVDLLTRRPASRWSGDIRVLAAPAGLQTEAGEVPPISRLDSGFDASVSAGGAIGTHGVGLFVSGRDARARRIERDDPAPLEPAGGSGLVHVVAVPNANREIRLFAAVTDATRPLASRARFADRDLTEDDRDVVLRGSVERQRGGALWTLGASWLRTAEAADVASGAAGGVVERLRDGVPLALVAPAEAHATRWELQVGLAPAAVRWMRRDHAVRVGATIGRSAATSEAGPQPAFREVVGGVPARVWDVRFGPGPSTRSATSAGIFASDRLTLSDRVTLMAAVRADWDRGSADGGAGAIDWFTVTPRATLRWRAAESFVITTGYGWYAHRLPLGFLAADDPAGPNGVVSRWDDRDGDGRDTPAELTPVQVVGGAASRIDDALRRPVTGEFRIGFEHALGSWRWGITGLDRRARNLPAVVNTGVTAADYAVSFVDDPGVDVEGRSGFEPLPIYDRRPASFLRDSYLLTTVDDEPTVAQGLEVSLDRDWARSWFIRFGGSAYRIEGVGANRGYRPDENDAGILGEAYVDPNATTNARGRLFDDRAFVIKVLAAYKGKGPLGAALVARYQDGQPFARYVVADGLNQGREIIQAYPRGAQRFHYTLTVDTRVDLQLVRRGHRRASLAVEAFNLSNFQQEWEEDIVTGPAFRTITAVQPPRVVRVGLTLQF